MATSMTMETICAFKNTLCTKKRKQQDLEQTVDKNDKKQKNECKSIYGGVDKLLLFVLYTRRTLMSKYII